MIADDVKTTAVSRMQRSADRIRRALEFIDDEELWRDFNPHLVSIGNGILPLWPSWNICRITPGKLSLR